MAHQWQSQPPAQQVSCITQKQLTAPRSHGEVSTQLKTRKEVHCPQVWTTHVTVLPQYSSAPNTNQGLQVSKHPHMPCCLKPAHSRTQARGHLCSAHTTHQCPHLLGSQSWPLTPVVLQPPAAFTQLTSQMLYTFLDQKHCFWSLWDHIPRGGIALEETMTQKHTRHLTTHHEGTCIWRSAWLGRHGAVENKELQSTHDGSRAAVSTGATVLWVVSGMWAHRGAGGSCGRQLTSYSRKRASKVLNCHCENTHCTTLDTIFWHQVLQPQNWS